MWNMAENWIEVKGARVHNLKNIDVKIPRNALIVITGVSGSGKSSLAFDTLYAEGQRRYVESLSSYARQFLGRIDKPEVDFIKGIPPAIAIEQKVNSRNPRSTVGTSTEIYDYLKLLFARIGRLYSPISGVEVKRHTVSDVTDYFRNLPPQTKVALLAPLHIPMERTPGEHLEILRQQGFSRVEQDGQFLRIEDAISQTALHHKPFHLVVDRLSVQPNDDTLARLADSAETAFYEGNGECALRVWTQNGEQDQQFSNRLEADGISFDEINEHLFAFNSPMGACPRCEGFGNVIGIDEDLVIPNKNLSIYDDAVAPWKGEKMGEWKDDLIRHAAKFDFPIHKPFYQLTESQRQLLWNGNSKFEGLHSFFRYVEEKQYKIQYRVMLARYRGKTVCPDCQGARLKKAASYVRIHEKGISQLVVMPMLDLREWFDQIALNGHEQKVAGRLLIEIQSRIHFLCDVGLGYLTLNRMSASLSGGESQRINLATSLGSSLVGSLYILDEPSIGLHSRDTALLISVLRQLKNLGNTVVVVEHDEDLIRAADEIIDIGPGAGRLGGEVVFAGNFEALNHQSQSLTTQYLKGELRIEVPRQRRKWNHYIELVGARENNLKNLTVKFPLNIATVITGVSGSGKSSLVSKVLYPALQKQLGGYADKTGAFDLLRGDYKQLQTIEFVDQNPIGKSSRSNPATYLKAYDEMRKLMADQQLAKQAGFTASHFSFNIDGGRCEECQGEGNIKVEMQFMADIVLVCEHCHGKRFKEEVLEVKYHGLNVFDILDLTVDQAIELFESHKGNTEKRIVQKLKPLSSVGLGYIKLGQASSTLSGGESQRVKLASFLANEKSEPTLFIFDEPTTGLHFHDIKKLLNAFQALIENGHSLLIVEHNMDVIKWADWVIDLGPEGGNDGGNLVFEGTPDQLIHVPESYTGKYLKPYLEHPH